MLLPVGSAESPENNRGVCVCVSIFKLIRPKKKKSHSDIMPFCLSTKTKLSAEPIQTVAQSALGRDNRKTHHGVLSAERSGEIPLKQGAVVQHVCMSPTNSN